MRISFLLLSFLLFVCTPALAYQTTPAKHAIIVDYETGQVLLDKESNVKMPTSSMSKTMTGYMIFQALKDGRITLDTKFHVSDKAWQMGGSKMFVGQGSDIDVNDLLQGVIVQSGNDATIVLAEGLSGSEEEFARQMTAQAKELGMNDSNFVNASGWPDPNHYSTAHDLALLAKHLITDFPEYYKFYSETEYTYSNIKQQNRNPLLYRNIGADGIKTGHTDIGGYGLMGSAQKDGRRVIMVVNGLESDKARADESVRLIEWGLNNFINIDLVKKGDVIAQAPLAMGKINMIDLVVNKDIKVTVPRIPKDSYSVEVSYKSPIVAPIKAGTEVGTFKVIIPDAENLTFPIVAARDVEKIGVFKGTLSKIKYKLLGKF